ncbi:hypothetical protein [Streptomyces sp.]|uniref:hypothetical protein n=1 Tax=Streptomyces sp. TaxID=1931 RepID=UPI002D77F027|nr:hypothetical protein [Streptomyces sp.]HET6356548.1 hypothetical protein [Streptomyces sp.]
MKRWPSAAAALAALLLVGCGIQETDVIEAGGPATLQVFPAGSERMLLFFASSDGVLKPVVRPVDSSEKFATDNLFAKDKEKQIKPGDKLQSSGATEDSTQASIAALFSGPLKDERTAGLTSRLPPLPSGAAVRIEPTGPAAVDVVLPVELRGLGETALLQLICTVAYSQDDQGKAAVRLKGVDTTLPSAGCTVDADRATTATDLPAGQ